MGDETFVVGGYVLGETLGTLTEEEVSQVDTTLNQDDNSYTVRFYGRDGELIQERQIPVEWSESELTSIDEEDLPVRGVRLDTNVTWEADLDMRYPHMTYDGTGMNFYGEDGELLWRADGVGVTVQGTSSGEYSMAGRNLDIDEEIFGPFDTDTEPRFTLTESEYQRYLDVARDSSERYLDIAYGTRTELRENFLRTRSRHLDEVFLKGEWKIPEEEEQPDIKDERGGALDEFLEKFTPQKTTPERSDEQE